MNTAIAELSMAERPWDINHCYTPRQNEHCDWLILGHVPLIKFKCILTQYNSADIARAGYNNS